MPGGAYSALTGMQARLQSLDRIAADLANINTAGYKTERTTRFVAERDFAAALDSAVDVTSGGTRTDLMPGSITNFAVRSERFLSSLRSQRSTITSATLLSDLVLKYSCGDTLMVDL